MSDKSTNGLLSRVDMARSKLLFELEQGRFAALERLPSERDLAVAVGVSRTTLRKAIVELIDQGQIEQRHGFGTFAVRRPSHGPKAEDHGSVGHDRISGSLSFELLERGDASGSKHLTSGFYLPRADEAMMLDVDPQAQVFRITRLWLAQDGRPIAYEEHTTPCETVGQMDQSLAVRTLRRIRSGTVADAAAAALGLEKNTIGLLSDERTFDVKGRCVAFTRLTRPIADLDLSYVLPAARIIQSRSA